MAMIEKAGQTVRRWLAPYFEDRLSRAIEWWFSNFSTHQDPSEGQLKHSLLAPPQSFSFSRSGMGPKNLHCFKEALFFSCSHHSRNTAFPVELKGKT